MICHRTRNNGQNPTIFWLSVSLETTELKALHDGILWFLFSGPINPSLKDDRFILSNNHAQSVFDVFFCADSKQLFFHSNGVADLASLQVLCMAVSSDISVVA